MTRFLKILAAGLALGTSASAQFTNILDNGSFLEVNGPVSTNLPFIIGSTTSSNFLFISAGGALNTLSGTVGDTVSASNNSVFILGENASWNTTGDIVVGNGGAENSIFITNGAAVVSANGYIGNSNTALGNFVLVTGQGSSWSSTNELTVGNSGSGNTLIIEKGGSVSNANGFVGAQSGTSNNVAFVAGADAEWVNAETLTVGAVGASSNLVVVHSGGTVTASNLVVHAGNNFNINGNGTLAITGEYDHSGQTNLNWNDGGTLSISGNLTGLDNLARSNQFLTIDGGTWTNTAGNRQLGVDGSGNVLRIQNGGLVNNASGTIGVTTNAIANFVLVTGTNSVWNNTGDLTVGENGAGNGLYIQNGGVVSNANAFIGRSAGGSNNLAEVFGEDARWINNGVLTIGATNTTGNNVSVSLGGLLQADELKIESGNSFSLQEAGTLAIDSAFDASMDGFNWNTLGRLSVGGELTGLAVTNGYSILDGEKLLALNGGSHSVTNDLVVGFESSNTSLSITNGGGAGNANGYIGWGAAAANNSVTVSDAGSIWTNTGNLYIGAYGPSTNLLDAGAGNSLTVSDGGRVYVGGVDTNLIASGGGIAVASGAEVVVGEKARVETEGLFVDDASDFELYGSLQISGNFDADQLGFNWMDGATLTANSNLTYAGDIGGTNKTLNVDGGSWIRGGDLAINGVNSSFEVLNGGTLLNVNGIIGATTNDSNNSVMVSDAGSLWDNSGDLRIGLSSADNSLTITDGGRVENVDGFIGDGVAATDNEVLVSGSNSVWQNSGNLYVGNEGSGNMLTIQDEGRGESAAGFIGALAGADSNTATVTGHGSVWSNTANLHIGSLGSDNMLSITGGGLVHNLDGYVGNANSAMANSVMVSGSNSIWRNTGDVYIGNDGFDNTLEIKSGGHVLSDNGIIGASSSSSGNVVTVNDSKWTNSGDLTAGQNGSENQLTIENGGRVDSDNGTIGSGAAASENKVTVTGEDSLWNNSGDLVVGASGSANELNILAGGAVSNGTGTVGANAGASGNLVSVSGSGSVWVNSGALNVGSASSVSNSVSVSNGGTVVADSLNIATNNNFNLKNKGTLAVTGNFDLTNQKPKLSWDSGGTVAIQGGLINTVEHNGGGQVLVIDGGTWLDPALTHTIGTTNSGAVFVIKNGGMVLNSNGVVGASGSSDNKVTVTGAGSVWENLDTLYIGTASNSGNSVTVENQGTVIADNLAVADNNNFILNDGGTLRMTGNFNVSTQTNLTWESGGNLSVGGALTGLAETETIIEGTTNRATYLGNSQIVTIAGAAARLSGNTNLIVGFETDEARLEIRDEGKVDNANGFIGWGAGSANNSVLVSGGGSVWTNRENLNIGGYSTSNSFVLAGTENMLTVESNAWVFVGDVTEAELGSTNGGVAVAATDGAELIIGNGGLTAETLYVGAGTNHTGFVHIRKEGEIALQNLIIADGANEFVLEGELTVSGDFNASPLTGFSWKDDGEVIVQNGDLTGLSSLGGTNRAITLQSANWMTNSALVIGSYGLNNQLRVSGNSMLVSGGATIGASNAVDSAVSLSGSNVVWNNTGSFNVGFDGSGNTLSMVDGAKLFNTGDAFIGVMSNAFNNAVIVSGSNTLWNNSGNLFVGNLGSSNSLTIAADANVRVGGDLKIQNGSTLSLSSSNSTITVTNNMTVADSTVTGTGIVSFGDGPNTLMITGTNSVIDQAVVFKGNGGVNGIVVSSSQFEVVGTLTNRFSDFSSLELTDSTLFGRGMLDSGIDTVTMNGGVLQLTGAFTINGEFVAMGQPTLKMTANEHQLNLNNAAPFNLAGLDAEITVESSLPGVGSFTPTLITSTSGLTGEFGALTFNERYLLYGFEPVYTNNQVSIKPVAAANGTISSTLAIAGSEGVRSGFRGMKSAVFTRTKQLRRNVVATANAIPQEAFLLSNTNAPAGAMGPGDQNTIFDMHIWLQHFSGQGDADAYGVSDGFTLNNHGTTIGADRLFGDALTVGMNYTYARSDARSTNNDNVDTETYWLGAYGEWVSVSGLYIDAMLAYGHSDYDSVRVADMYRGTAKYAGNNYGAYADVGQYYHYKNLAVSPYIGLHALATTTEDYIETDLGGNQVRVDESSRSWVESAIGIKARHRFDTRKGRFQTTGYAEWMHDFLQEDIESELSMSGLGPIDTARISPDADVLGIGAGFSWICTDYMEIGLGYNGRFSDHYEEHTASAMIDVRF